jgi:TetR/AcrR family transcriptional regulator, ethionamide resistance regulator
MSTRPAATARRATSRVRRAEARERILAAAERLLRERPYRELSVEEVMAEAGLSRTVFYRHFDGLPELVLTRLSAIGAGLAAELDVAPAPGRVREILAAAVQVFAEHGPFLRAVEEAASHDAEIEVAYRAFVGGFTEVMAGQIQQGMDDGRIKPGNAYELARALNLMNKGYLLDTLGRDPSFDQALALETLDHVWASVASSS